MTIAKVQHYVPQFLLRNFGNGKKDQLCVYDKTSGRTFFTNAKNIASESRFYNFGVDGRTVTLEPQLSAIETATKPILERVLRRDSVAGLSASDRAVVAVFLSIQFTRTRAFREQWRDLPRTIRNAFEAKGWKLTAGSQAAQLAHDLTEDELKAETGRFMMEAPQAFAKHFLSKDWVLAATTRARPFLLGDNPLTMQNLMENANHGGRGLAVPGVEIYLPLSPTRALAMWCPSLTNLIVQAASTHRPPVDQPADATQVRPDQIDDFVESLSSHRRIIYAEENVENFNSLQVAGSERYIFSPVDDFKLADQMLAAHPELKRGPRGEAS